MPPRKRNRSNVSIYLDQSTFSDAFRAMAIGDRAAGGPYLELASWLTAQPANVDLCFGVVHVAELAAWAPSRRAGMPEWLDGLPLVWLRGLDPLRETELDHWLQVGLGGSPDPVEFTEPSMLRALGEFTAEGVAEALAQASVAGAVQACRREAITEMRNTVMAAAQAINSDRKAWFAQGKNREDGEERAQQNLREELRQLAVAADERLRRTGDDAYAKLKNGFGPSQDAIMDQWQNNPRALPSRRIDQAFIAGLATTAEARTPGSAKWKELASSAADWWHAATGGAYCDVFTCDRLTAEWISDARAALGFPPPLARGRFKDHETFVAAIIHAVAEARRTTDNQPRPGATSSIR